MKQLYQQYRKLDNKIKRSRIDNAKQSQHHRKPNPQANHQFDQYCFIDFYVLQNNKKIRLQTYRTNAKGIPIGVIFMFHGLNSYIGHGAHLAEYFSKNGLITVGFDHRGFGRSQGRQGYVDDLKSHLSDCMQFIKLVFPLYHNLPKFALGLSMGGMTSYYLTLQHPNLFDGAILMAPSLKNLIGGGFVKLTGILGSILPDKTKLTKPIYGKATKNPAITQFIKQDKYSFSERMSLSTVQMLVSTMDKSPKTFHLYKCPFMIIQGGLDKLVNPQVAFELYDKSQTRQQDKQFLFYENMWHDIWHQQQIYDILPKIVAWILKRIQKYKLEHLNGQQNLNKKQSEQNYENDKQVQKEMDLQDEVNYNKQCQKQIIINNNQTQQSKYKQQNQ